MSWCKKGVARAVAAGHDVLKMSTVISYFRRHRAELCESLLDLVHALATTYHEQEFQEEFKRCKHVIKRLAQLSAKGLIDAFTKKGPTGQYEGLYDGDQPVNISIFKTLIPAFIKSIIIGMTTVGVNDGRVAVDAFTYLAERVKKHAKTLALHMNVIKNVIGDEPPTKGAAKELWDTVTVLHDITNKSLLKLQRAIDSSVEKTIGFAEYNEELPISDIRTPSKEDIYKMSKELEQEVAADSLASSSSSSSSSGDVSMAVAPPPHKRQRTPELEPDD